MKRWIALLLGIVVALHSAAGDWPEEVLSKPGAFPALRPLRTHYRFGWTAFTAAEGDFDFARAKGGLARMSVSAKTVGVPRTLWRMDTQASATMQPATLRPAGLRQTEVYGSETKVTKLDFDAAGVTRLREVKPGDGKPAKQKRFDFQNLFDLHSAFHMLRSQRMQPGDVYKVAVYASTAPYLTQAEVLGRARVEAGGKKWDAIKLNVKLWKIDDDTLKLEPYQKFKRATVWLSDDANRLLLKAEGEIFVGSVWAELEKVEWKAP
jgi:hypothetical protein